MKTQRTIYNAMGINTTKLDKMIKEREGENGKGVLRETRPQVLDTLVSSEQGGIQGQQDIKSQRESQDV